MSVKVKICGLTSLADAQVATEAGADFLGFILYAKSPRYVTPDAIGEILAGLALGARPTRPQTVGVFVNTPADEVAAILAQTGLDLAQLHGDEAAAAVASFQGRAYKALRPKDAAVALDLAATYAPLPAISAPQLMLDAYTPDAYGGTGQRTDWTLAAALVKATPRLMLAGGLTPDNVADAIQAVRPWAVDVASGVEAAPGRKDHDAVRAFVANARKAVQPLD